mgnify:CR=1 FL=1
MRNLKRVFAVIITVAMLATMMVPALAEASHLEEARKLQKIGLIAGTTDAELNLEGSLNRIQGIAFAIRAAGKEDDAFALTDEEVAEILADVVDADDIPGWNGNGPKYVAYAVKTGMTIGVDATILPKVKFAPMAPMSGAQFLTFLLKSMGYKDATTNNAADIANQDAKFLSAGQAVQYVTKDQLLRDDCAAILYSAAMKGVNADGKRFIEALIESGDVDREKAIEAGFVAPVTELKALDAKAPSLKEIVVTFNAALNKDAAENKDNYAVEAVESKVIKSVKLNSDGKSVIILLENALENQQEFKVTVKAGVGIKEDTQLSGTAFDVTIPEAVSVVQTGPDTFKVIFSEPIKATTGTYKVDDGRYFIAKIEAIDDYSVSIKLYTTIPTGEHKVVISGVEDYVPYKSLSQTLYFTAVKDEAAPEVVSVEKASPEEVILVFNEDIQLVISAIDEIQNKALIYHTNSNNVPSGVTVEGAKLKLDFKDNKLPSGTAYLTIKENVVKDGWNNKNAEIKNLPINVTVDREKPYVKDIKAETDKKIVITFNEGIESVKENYTFLDASGDKLADEYSIEDEGFKVDNDKVTIEFNKALPGSTYTVVIEGVKDKAGNEIDKVSVPVTVTDTTRPEVTTTGVIYKDAKIVKISFSEVMNSDDILNLGNYAVGTTYLSDDKVTASVTDGGKAVLLNFKNAEKIKLDEIVNVSGKIEITVGRVRDAAGNYSKLSTTVVCTPFVGGITIESVEAVNKTTLVVKLSDALNKFDKDDFEVFYEKEENSKEVIATAGVIFENVDGKGVLTYTLADGVELDTTGKYKNKDVYVSVIASESAIKSENAFGIKLEAGSNQAAIDKIPAEIASVAKSGTKALVITFTEEIKKDTVSKYTFTVDGNTVTGISWDTDGTVLSDKVLTLQLEKELGSKVTVRQVLNIEDSKGNVSKDLKVEDKALEG